MSFARNPDDLSRVLELVQRSKFTLDKSLGSALVSSLAEEGRIANVREVVEQVEWVWLVGVVN